MEARAAPPAQGFSPKPLRQIAIECLALHPKLLGERRPGRPSSGLGAVNTEHRQLPSPIA